jgi:hypothetical protein
LSTVEDVTEKLKNETGEIHFQHLS